MALMLDSSGPTPTTMRWLLLPCSQSHGMMAVGMSTDTDTRRPLAPPTVSPTEAPWCEPMTIMSQPSAASTRQSTTLPTEIMVSTSVAGYFARTRSLAS